MGQYDGVNDIDAGTERLPKLDVGEMTLEVLANKSIMTKRHGKAILAEFKVLESTNETNKPGTTAAYMLYEKDQMFFKNLKSYACAVNNSRDVKGPDIEAMVDPLNPSKGVKIHVRVFMDTAKESKRQYKAYSWRYVSGL